MFERFKTVKHTEESAALYEFTLKAYVDLAKNSSANDKIDQAMKAHLLKIVEQIGIPDYDLEYEEAEEVESPKTEHRKPILIHDRRRNEIRKVA